MKDFMDKDFLLSGKAAKKLYHDYAKNMPVIDYHCHVSPQEIAEDISFDNITQIWLGGDHYKWRQMRAAGIDEYYITGDAPDREKFQMWAKTLPRLIGNPLYHWSHLELKKYFGYDGILNENTAEEVWNLCNKKLEHMSAQDIIRMSHVEVICTTDDPADSLKWHKKIAESDFEVSVLPAWRPDNLLYIEKPDFRDYIEKLSHVCSRKITDYASLKAAISERMDYFHQRGCRVSDHGLPYVMYVPADENEINRIFSTALNGGSLSQEQILKFRTKCLTFMAEKYFSLGWVMQLHYGVTRNENTRQFQKLGADTGFDSIGDSAPISSLSAFLDSLAQKNCLPKTILYSLNPTDNASIDTLIGCFQDGSYPSRIQHGAAWWFNDHKTGITEHLTSLANLGILSNFVGMLTDSRSFLSYTRHDYFRRILCEFIGNLVENGEYPQDYDTLGKIVQDISYYNAKAYFDFT